MLRGLAFRFGERTDRLKIREYHSLHVRRDIGKLLVMKGRCVAVWRRLSNWVTITFIPQAAKTGQEKWQSVSAG
jgi:hypothetical protein